jgi:hypothetical protein
MFFIRFFCFFCSIYALHGDFLNFGASESQVIAFVQDAVSKANKEESKLSAEALSIDGMSSPKVRHLLNNLCSSQGVRYLEIGSWKGSTLIAALYENNIPAIAIDNWSEFGGPRHDFYSNVKKFIPDAPLKVHEMDCFSINKQLFPSKINVYFYDGGHSHADQEAAFTYYNDIFEDVFVAIVDDWNWPQVQSGTFSAFKKLKYKILFSQELKSKGNGDTSSWWNGIYIAVIKK